MLTLRPIEREDLKILKIWRNQDCVRSTVREYRLLCDSDQESWYNAYLSSRRKSDFDQEILIIEGDGHYLGNGKIQFENKRCQNCVPIPIGVGGFTRVEWRNRRAELTFYLGDTKSEIYREECVHKLLEKGFNEFGFHKITWPVYGHDTNIQLYKTIFDT